MGERVSRRTLRRCGEVMKGGGGFDRFMWDTLHWESVLISWRWEV